MSVTIWTDSHALLHKSSFHPKHIFMGLLEVTVIEIVQNLHSPGTLLGGHQDAVPGPL